MNTLYRTVRNGWLVVLTFAAAALSLGGAAHAREWSDSSGKFKIEAELVSVIGDQVKLKKPDGTTVTVPKSRLSAADLEFLAERAKARPSTAIPSVPMPPPQTPAPETATPKPATPRAATVNLRSGRAAIEQALASKGSIEFAEEPLASAVRKLGLAAGVPAVLDTTALKEAGSDPDSPVTYSGRNALFGESLEAILAPLQLVWLVHREVLFVTTPAASEEIVETRVYGFAQPLPPAPDSEAVTDELIVDMMDSVAPMSWAAVGGRGYVDPLPPCLVVLQTYAIHREIERKYTGVLLPLVRPQQPIAGTLAMKHAPIMRVLSTPASAEFADLPLSDALAQLAAQGKTTITIGAAVTELGLTPELPVSLNVSSVPLGALLDLLLEPYALTYRPTAQGLEVTTLEDIENAAALLPIAYPVNDLVQTFAADDPETLSSVVIACIDPIRWDDVGGTGTIQPNFEQGTFDIRQTIQTHLLIDQFFSDLRAAMAAL